MMIRILIFSFIYLAATSKVPCSPEYGIDITDGEILPNGDVLKGGLTYTPQNYLQSNGTITGCICNIKPCMRKCCPMGEFMQNKTCQPSYIPFEVPGKGGPSLNTFHLIYGFNCTPGKKRSLLDPVHKNNKINAFHLEADGTLFLPAGRERLSPLEYCIDYIEEDREDAKSLVCIVDRKSNVSTTNVIGMVISMPFLLATFCVYAFLPDRNLHGKCLMCYVMTLFLAYLFLVIAQLYPTDLEDTSCIAVGILCLLFFMVSFFLMNVMSIDIWWTFSGLRGFSGTRKETERKRFLLYSAYAWGVPLILVVIVTSLTLNTDLPFDAWYYPGIANGQCWFANNISKMIYFYGPIALLILTNLILFIVTAFKIKRVQQATAVLRKDDSKKHSYENDKQRFNLYFRLLLAMGINWSTEIISWIVDWQIVQVPQSVWYFTDFLNAVYGVFIFFIFAFKKNIWRLLKKRYYSLRGQPNLANTVTLVDYSPNAIRAPNQNNIDSNKSNHTNVTPLTSEVA